MKLQGKRFLVTGGSKGIGRAIARALRADGALVVITGRDRERLEAAARELGAYAVPGDVAVEADAARSVREAVAHLGGLDGLINNAGIGGGGPLEDLELQEFKRVLAVNVLGAAVMAREAIPHLRRAKGGDIVNIASTSGLKGDAGSTAYAASKFALRGMTQCWQAELRRDDIRVILVNPSYVQTNFGGSEEPTHFERKFLRPEDIAQTVLDALRMERRGFIPEVTVFATNPW